MRKLLLTTAVLGLTASTTWAGEPVSKYDTAIEAQIGENKFTVDSEKADSVVWKFTADKNYIAKVGTIEGNYDFVYVSTIQKNADTQKNDTITMTGAAATYPSRYYPLKKGTTYYMTIVTKGETGLTLEVEENDELSGGTSADSPMNISLNGLNFIGDPYFTGYNGYTAYARFKADATGALALSSNSWLSTTLNNTRYEGVYNNGAYVIKIPVEEGQTYDLSFSLYSPMVLSAEMTFPTPGSIDVPFELKEGENTAPADNKDYYYTYTPSTAGYLSISSDKSLPGGCVKIYDSKSSINYGSVKAQSETGSYNVRVEIPYIPSSPYYIVVSRTDKAEADETFTATMEAYKEGETEDTPYTIDELPATNTIPTATGTYYYSVTVPANTNKFLHVETGLGTSVAYGTQIAIYPKGSSIYSGVTGYDNLDLNVTNTVEQAYTIKVMSAETTPVTFTVSYKDINKGDLITNPEDAVLGENKITANGTRYYAYTPTQDCKLVLTATPDMVVSFPLGTGTWDGNHEIIQSGVDYYFGVTGGTQYLIKLENCVTDDVFSLAEEQFKQGEDRTNPVVIENGEYTLTKTNAVNLWLSYTAKQDGILTISTDVPYNYNNNVEYGKESDNYLSTMMSTVYDPAGNSVTKYQTSLGVSAGDVIIVHTALSNLDKDYAITFTERDYQQGETIDMPYVLEEGKAVNLPVATRNAPVWVKAKLGVGTAEFKANDYLSGTIYKNVDDAKADQNGSNFYFSADYSPSEVTYNFTKDVAEGEDGEYYFYITSSNSVTEVVMTKSNATVNGISTINENANVNDNVDVYSINGTKVATVKNIASANLKSGVYVIISNGNAKKIVVK